MAGRGGGEWLVRAEYHDSGGRHQSAADIELRWADSWATSYHYSHVGHAIQVALQEAKAKLKRQQLAVTRKGKR